MLLIGFNLHHRNDSKSAIVGVVLINYIDTMCSRDFLGFREYQIICLPSYLGNVPLGLQSSRFFGFPLLRSSEMF